MFQYFKKQLHEGDTIGILFQGETYYGKVLERGMAQVNDYSITIETEEGLKMLFPITREVAFIIPAKEEVVEDASDSGDEQGDPENEKSGKMDYTRDVSNAEHMKGPHEPKD